MDIRRAAQGILAALCVASVTPAVAGTLENDAIRAEFNATGLAGITDKASSKGVCLASDHFAAFAGNESIESDFLSATLEQESATNRVYRFESGPWTARVAYELQPGWRFVSKQVLLAHSGKAGVRVQRLEMWRGQVETPIAGQQRIRDGTLLRFADGSGPEPTHGMFLALQNPFLQLKRQEQRLSAAYPPDVMWNPTNGVYASDRLLFGLYAMSGMRSPARMVPEWKLVTEAPRADDAWLDAAEVDALVECVRSFLLYRPKLPVRVMIGWTVNDYQIDIATPEGRTEYKRIIDQAAAVGAQHLLFDPANSVEAPLSENRDAWGWENLLWFTMGQKLRKGEWDPATDKLPSSVQELLDYARAKEMRFLAYVYPSLPFLQQKEWTSWVPNGRPGGYLGADTGQRSFQDWLVGKLVDFHRTTGASGFSFDHWWIAYDETDSSKYAQWDGCRRILDQLRLQIPDVVLDGRQQYHHFGSWTWLAGTFPHPLMSDEQPESFPAFPDLHWSRVSADRQRRTAWYFRQECFTPVEIIPGYMTHQTPRLTATGECPRDRFRPADWDLLGWKYSVISSIATAPFNHVINFLPARDEREFKAFSAAEQQWFRDWLDWTDRNIDILREVKPILGAPQLGRVDGTAAFKDARGYVFLFNPNYRQLPAEFKLDKSIGLTSGDQFILRQLYPDPERGRLLAPRGKAFWNSGDTVALGMAGTEAVVLEVSPAPATVDQPLLLGAVGRAVLNNGRLELTGVRSEVGLPRAISVVLPSDRTASSATVNGRRVEFRQVGSLVSMTPKFTGTPFPARAQIGRYDPSFAGSSYRAEVIIPSRVFAQLEARKRSWPVEYTEEERAAVWLNSDRLILFINIAEPDYQNTNGVTLKVNGEPVPVKPAYTSIVRSNPRNTFVGWYADVSSLKPDVKHTFEVELPKLAPGQFQGLFFDTVEEEYTHEVATTP